MSIARRLLIAVLREPLAGVLTHRRQLPESWLVPHAVDHAHEVLIHQPMDGV
jgi:hypothetical protein